MNKRPIIAIVIAVLFIIMLFVTLIVPNLNSANPNPTSNTEAVDDTYIPEDNRNINFSDENITEDKKIDKVSLTDSKLEYFNDETTYKLNLTSNEKLSGTRAIVVEVYSKTGTLVGRDVTTIEDVRSNRTTPVEFTFPGDITNDANHVEIKVYTMCSH